MNKPTYLFEILWSLGIAVLCVCASQSQSNSRQKSSRPTVRVSLFHLLPFALWLLTRATPWTNVLDVGLLRLWGIKSSSYPYDSWAAVTTFPSVVTEYLLRNNFAPDVIAALFSLLGFYCWYFAYLILLRLWLHGHVLQVLTASTFSLLNLLTIAASPIFGFVAPWVGSSTFGMLGAAMLALSLALQITGQFSCAVMIHLLLMAVSPVNALLSLAGLVFSAIHSLWIKQPNVFALIGIFGSGILTFIMQNSNSSYAQSPSPESYSSYLELWDLHRNTNHYKLSVSSILVVALAVLLCVYVIRTAKVRKSGYSVDTPALTAIVAVLSSLLVLDALQRLSLAVGLVQSASSFPAIGLMPLRLTESAGFLSLALGLLSASEWKARTRRFKLSYQILSHVLPLALMISAFVYWNFDMNQSWLNYYLNNRSQNFAKPQNPFDSANVEKRVSLAAPGLSESALWEFGLRVPIHDRVVESVAYQPEMLKRTIDFIVLGYGLDFFHPKPPPRCGCIPQRPEIRNLWERRTKSEWLRVSKDLRIEYVLVPSDWKIKLNQIEARDDQVLYRIP